MKNKEVTIFLIEDDDVDATGIERGFAKMRIANKIVRARDGQEALEMLKARQVPVPYIVLLDLNMPRMDGLSFLEELRKDEQLRNTVVFILTTSSSDDDIVSCYKHLIAGYFVKNEAGNGFQKVVDMLNGYWNIVHLPAE